jgi:uncharacterized NAD-dependent epimerase/dehydratase family protein
MVVRFLKRVKEVSMRAPNSLERAAMRHGMSVADLVTTFVERAGTVKGAAREMGVAYPDVWRWIRENCYTVKTGRWAKVIPPAPILEPTVSSSASEIRYEPVED